MARLLLIRGWGSRYEIEWQRFRLCETLYSGMAVGIVYGWVVDDVSVCPNRRIAGYAAVERTFVRFYPTLMEIAREKGTVKLGF